MFRFRPSLVAELLADALGVAVPDHRHAQLQSGELTDLLPTEYRADAVVVLSDAEQPVLAVVVEVQLSRDGDKRWSWPVYVATLRARWRCPVELLVVCPSSAVAEWCARAIELGLTGSRMTPVVLGPERLPVPRAGPGVAPEMVVLSALAHGGDPARYDVLDMLLDALSSVEEKQAFLYLEMVYAALPAAARGYLEGLMSTETEEELSPLAQWFFTRGEARGETRGGARAVLTVLETRGVEVPDDVRARILACTDPAQLDEWVRRAITATTVDDLTA